jgi:hypothetical protein
MAQKNTLSFSWIPIPSGDRYGITQVSVRIVLPFESAERDVKNKPQDN